MLFIWNPLSSLLISEKVKTAEKNFLIVYVGMKYGLLLSAKNIHYMCLKTMQCEVSPPTSATEDTRLVE